MELANRTVLVTGGSSGIGLGLAEAFHSRGSTVILCARAEKALAAAAERLPGAITLSYDLADEQQHMELAAEVLRRFPAMDVLVNNAGVQKCVDLKKGYAELKSGEDEIAVNFVAIVELTALFIEHLLGRPSATIINVSSRLGFMPMLSLPIYCATKAAVHTYSLVLRQQLKGTPVEVVEIAPPMVDTNLNRSGRDAAGRGFRGVSISEYIPTVVEGLEGDTDTIFYGDGKDLLSRPRGESEGSLLNPSL
jgi:uncharacterized oxidoreductase